MHATRLVHEDPHLGGRQGPPLTAIVAPGLLGNVPSEARRGNMAAPLGSPRHPLEMRINKRFFVSMLTRDIELEEAHHLGTISRIFKFRS
jgi:hypothetical protein